MIDYFATGGGLVHVRSYAGLSVDRHVAKGSAAEMTAMAPQILIPT